MKKIQVLTLISLIFYTILGCQDEPLPELGGGYKIDNDFRGGDVLLLDSANDVIISDRVISTVADSVFVLVLQKPWERIITAFDPDGNANLGEHKNAFAESNIYQYWIINKQEPCTFDERTLKYFNVHGPFTKQEYLFQRKRLSVPDGLRFEELK